MFHQVEVEVAGESVDPFAVLLVHLQSDNNHLHVEVYNLVIQPVEAWEGFDFFRYDLDLVIINQCFSMTLLGLPDGCLHVWCEICGLIFVKIRFFGNGLITTTASLISFSSYDPK